mmetsp:Transcript_96850/g.172361  ORF Transcript_96850/g.172361 Transcript_96850/m.172361 type:complete len:472 (+) Transcript_96850:101-1516(+)
MRKPLRLASEKDGDACCDASPGWDSMSRCSTFALETPPLTPNQQKMVVHCDNSTQRWFTQSWELQTCAPVASLRYRLCGEVIGGGAKGTVQTAVDLDTGQPVAVKSVQADKGLPIRFLQFLNGKEEINAEGYVPEQNNFSAWDGEVAFDASNPFGTKEFDAGTVEGRIVLLRRGGISFFAKVQNAVRGGAIGVIFINEEDSTEVYSFGGEKHLLPSVMITRSDGDRAIALCQHRQQAGTTLGRTVVQVRTDVGHEACVSRELSTHRNVVEVLDAWEEGEAAVIVMHLCRGGPAFQGNHALRQRFGDAWLTQALKLIRQMLEGIAHLHQHGICHRDLKPENLLLTGPPENSESCLVIADFSMASRSTCLWVPCGSPKYLAPEVLTGIHSVKRDVWSAGVMAYELLFGQHPLGATDKEALQRLQSDDLFDSIHLEAKRDKFSDEVIDLLAGMLQPEPDKRLSAAEALVHPALL